jgi:hypothetical protein
MGALFLVEYGRCQARCHVRGALQIRIWDAIVDPAAGIERTDRNPTRQTMHIECGALDYEDFGSAYRLDQAFKQTNLIFLNAPARLGNRRKWLWQQITRLRLC